MILRLTLQDVLFRENRDVEVVASPDDTVGSLLALLPLNTDGRGCFVGSVPLDPAGKLADSPLLPGAVLSVGGPGPDYHPARGESAGTVEVLAGPDAGFGVALQPGRHAVGRMPEAAVRLHDPAISRSQALIEVHQGGRATVYDLGSTNGMLVNDQRVAGPTALPAGSVIRVGRSLLRWTPASSGGPRVTQTGDGRLEFDRVFTAVPAIPQGDVDLPAQDPAARNPLTMVLGSVGGLASGIVLAAVMGNPLMLFVSLFGPLVPLGVYAVEGRPRRQRKAFLAQARADTNAQIAALAAEEDRVRRLLAPGPAEVIAMATGARPDLWPRSAQSPHGLVLRVGVADQPPSVRVRGEPWEGFQLPVLANVPVTLDLRETGVLGVIGTGEPARALLRWLLVQVVTLRSPDDLRLVLLTADSGEDIRWARWLPHLDAGGTAQTPPCWIGNTDASRGARIEELRRLIDDRRAGPREQRESSARFDGEVVVVLDGALALRKLPGIRDVLQFGPEVGVYILCADTRGMSECRGLCELVPDGLRLIRTPNAAPVTALPEGLDPALTEQASRAMAPMRDRISAADVRTSIPYPVRLLDQVGMGTPTTEGVLGLWQGKRPGPSTRVVLGADAAGPVAVDLARQGPHTMLGGATGAGKSILLQTLVTTLLLANRPEELNLVLVDFKGGSAFLPFQHCPHVVALIRSTGETAADSFTEADAARMLASVRAEVRRREVILARHGGEIDQYWRARAAQPDLPPLPRLVMIFDEFARVIDTSPNFLKELVNVAGKGRSLGMHLVLATQSLQGKLSPELKNNISLRISLRQNEATDSVEVLGAPDAAAIPGTLSGRGMILCTTDENRAPRPFQSGYLGHPPPATASQLTVRAIGWTDLGAARQAASGGDGAATDQELAIAAIEQAAGRAGAVAPFRALLPPLPASVPLERLVGYQTAAPPATAVPFGLADVPDQQAQPTGFLDLAATGRLMVAGGPQSGRTTFARTLITSLATRFPPGQAHIYVVEHQPAGLSQYAALPHCGGVFSPVEPDRVRRLVEWLERETQRRAAARFDPGRPDDPFIVVVVDGWEQFESRADSALADVSLGPTLREIMAAGAPLGVHIVPMGGQEMLTGKVPALCSQRLLLPFPNEETLRVQLRSGMTAPPAIPGRAVDAATGRHLQVCLPGISGTELAASVTATHDPGPLDPRRFPPLPARVEATDLPLPAPPPSPSWIPLGIGGPDVTTVGIDLFDADPHLMFISGPPGSGRTTAIATLARLLSWNGIDVITVSPPQSPLRRMLEGEDAIRVMVAATVDDAVLRETAEPFGDGRYVVLLDDADRITMQATKQGFSDSPTLLDEIAHPSAAGHRALILAGDVTPILAGSRRSLAKVTNEILLGGSRLLLSPVKRKDARDLAMSLEPDQYFSRPPGRGFLATTGAPMLIQLAVAR